MRCNTLYYSATQYTTVNYYQSSGQHNSLPYSFIHIIRHTGRQGVHCIQSERSRAMNTFMGGCVGAFLYRAVLRCTLPGEKQIAKRFHHLDCRNRTSDHTMFIIRYSRMLYQRLNIKSRITQRIVIPRTENFRLKVGYSNRRIFAIEFITYRYTSDRKNRSTEFSADYLSKMNLDD